MEAALAALPEFEVGRLDLEAAPEVWAGDFAFFGEAFSEFVFALSEVGADGDLVGLFFGNPGSDFGVVGTAGEVVLGDFAGGFFDGAADADLALEFFPVEVDGAVGVFGDVLGFA